MAKAHQICVRAWHIYSIEIVVEHIKCGIQFIFRIIIDQPLIIIAAHYYFHNKNITKTSIKHTFLFKNIEKTSLIF